MGKGKSARRREANFLKAQHGLLKKGKVSLFLIKSYQFRRFLVWLSRKLVCTTVSQPRHRPSLLPPPPSKNDALDPLPRSLSRMLALKVKIDRRPLAISQPFVSQ
jgi:hypothetical protein